MTHKPENIAAARDAAVRAYATDCAVRRLETKEACFEAAEVSIIRAQAFLERWEAFLLEPGVRKDAPADTVDKMEVRRKEREARAKERVEAEKQKTKQQTLDALRKLRDKELVAHRAEISAELSRIEGIDSFESILQHATVTTLLQTMDEEIERRRQATAEHTDESEGEPKE